MSLIKLLKDNTFRKIYQNNNLQIKKARMKYLFFIKKNTL